MKRALLNILERFGYVLIHSDVWRSVQYRLSAAHVDQPQTSDSGIQPAPEKSGQSLPEKNRAHTQVQALERRCAGLEAELRACQDQLAQADSTGRVRALEEENRRLARRLADLEVYLKETRGTGQSAYL